jgi:NTP pyrophosphatase (non-canonical NTP hydrolase)
VELRKSVEDFAQSMEHILRANDHKVGWQGMSLAELFRRILQELDELRDAIGRGKSVAAIRREAADVGNFAMFFHDIALNRDVQALAREAASMEKIEIHIPNVE